MKIRELFSDKSKWTQGCLAKDKNGDTVDLPFSREVVCWCLIGAIFKCYKDSKGCHKTLRKIKNKIKPDYKPTEYISVEQWNDDPKRTFEEVKQLVEELDI